MADLDIKFNVANAGLFDKDYRQLPAGLSSGELFPVVSTFARNCDRVFEMNATLMNIIYYTRYLANADRDVRRSLNLSVSDTNPASNPEYIKGIQAKSAELAAAQTHDEQFWPSLWEEAGQTYQQYIDNRMFSSVGTIGLIASMAIWGWMCFEYMAIDMWKAAVNRYPQPLAENILKSSPSNEAETSPREQKTIPLNTLQRYNFNIATSMGDILASSGRVVLSSLSGILDAYSKAFSADFSRSMLHEDQLKKLESIRNLYAHRGGIVDETFVRRMAGGEYRYPLKVGQEFLITGEDVCGLMDAMILSATALIKFVDGWMNDQSPERDQQGTLSL